jgi:hypothetical protein
MSVPKVGDIGPFHGSGSGRRVGAVRSAMWDIGQAPPNGPLRPRRPDTPHRRPGAFGRQPRCALLIVLAQPRSARLAGGNASR